MLSMQSKWASKGVLRHVDMRGDIGVKTYLA
jgi:hypothetical protein